MYGLPKRTEISKQIFKKDLLLRFNGTLSAKKAFNEDVDSIRVINEISSRSIAVAPGKVIKAFFVVEVSVRSFDFNSSIIQPLFDIIHQNVILVFRYEDLIKVAVCYKKLFLTEWKDSGYKLNIEGLTIDDVWQHIIESIGGFSVPDGKTLDETIDILIKNEELDKEIAALEKKMRSTKTPSKKADLYNKILELKGRRG